ncbi:MAG TPA: hypothetical protein VK034_16035 [Enhygromyxa sp.]|nr:hypothetical protein [Enhygromyxa sp.]
MIAYEVLVQTIADWKAGVRPTAPTPPRAPIGSPQPVEEMSSGVVDLDEDDESFAAEEYETETEYDESQYQQPASSYDDEDGY